LLIAPFVFGPRRLPEMGRTLGRAIREVRRAVQDLSREVGAAELVDDVKGLDQADAKVGEGVRRDLGPDELDDLSETSESRTTR
jgi:sec-independent protein translocase protein TatA